jgi:hypothetical protein
MKKLFVFLAIASLIACDKSDDLNPAVFVDTAFEFIVFNSQDVDLLDPATPNHFEEDDIKLFYEIDGELTEVYDAHLDHPRHFKIFEHENEYRIRVFLNDSDAVDEPITHIQWNEDDTDVIKASFKRPKSNVIVNKVWLNDTQIWDLTTDGDDSKFFKLIK